MIVVRPLLPLVPLVVAATVLTGCGGGESASAPRTSPTAPSSAPTTPAPTGPSTSAPEANVSLPSTPTRTDAAALARELAQVDAILRDRGAPAIDVRQAGELQQLAVRVLARAPDRFVRTVTTRLRPALARQTRDQVTAARLLLDLTDPQPRLPPWRIVEPPPPGELRAHYRAAQRRTGVDWTYLAAIHLVETRMGRIRGTSTAGAQGPMQFIPETWARYGAGGDINDPGDAILAAARLLRAHGAPGDMADALWHYNPSDRYVGAVTGYARTMQAAPSAYRGYWHWRVLYRHQRGTYVLPVGYPQVRAELLERE